MPSFSIGKLLGFPIKVNLSFLLLLGMAVLWSGGLSGLELVALAFASVLAHELGHALVARRLNVRIQEIELHFFGGAAKMIDMPRLPRHEIAIAAAGPLVSLALAACSYAGFLASGVQVLFWMTVVNLGIAVFNLLPALPMDGGRIFRAALTGPLGHLRATEVSIKLARGFALSLAVMGLYWGHLQLVGLAVLLWVMGSAELRAARFESPRPAFEPMKMWRRLTQAWRQPAVRPRINVNSHHVKPHQPQHVAVEYLPPPVTSPARSASGSRAARPPLRVVVVRS